MQVDLQRLQNIADALLARDELDQACWYIPFLMFHAMSSELWRCSVMNADQQQQQLLELVHCLVCKHTNLHAILHGSLYCCLQGVKGMANSCLPLLAYQQDF